LFAPIKLRLLTPMVAVVAGFALAGPTIATSSASDNSIIGVVNHWSPIVKHDNDALAANQTAYKKNRRAGPVVAAYQHAIVDLRSFAARLGRQSASSGTAARGRDDITAGLVKIAQAYGSFAAELKQAGSRGLSPKQINTNLKIQLAGHDQIVAGLKLLQKIA
jgi:hypothetical protein